MEEDLWYTPYSSPRQISCTALDRKRGTLIAEQAAMMAQQMAQLVQKSAQKPALSSHLTDPTFLAFFYHHVAAASYNALDQTGLWMHFQMEGITMVGGAVLSLYGLNLPYYLLQTSDIDLTWYLHAHPAYPSSQPQAVEALGDALCITLKEQLMHPHVLGYFQSILCHPLTQGFEIIPTNRVVAYGSYSLAIRLEGLPFADLTLHDGFGSQSYDDDHQPILHPRSMPMWNDPMYPREQYILKVVEGIWPIRIPSLEVYVKQQLFAAGNLMIAGKEKGDRVMQRVIYVIRAKPSAAHLMLLMEKLMMLQRWPVMERIKPMLHKIKKQLDHYRVLKRTVAPHVPL